VNIASESAHLSLAQRIAKVRDRMLVELSTGVSATEKDLFVSLCQTYEQNGVETSCTASTSSQNTLGPTFSISDLTPESVLTHGLTTLLGRDTLPKQHRIGFSIIGWPHLADDEFDDWDDWSKKS
jgi:hypothetical protein